MGLQLLGEKDIGVITQKKGKWIVRLEQKKKVERRQRETKLNKALKIQKEERRRLVREIQRNDVVDESRTRIV
jgi:hypothetical protein